MCECEQELKALKKWLIKYVMYHHTETEVLLSVGTWQHTILGEILKGNITAKDAFLAGS